MFEGVKDKPEDDAIFVFPLEPEDDPLALIPDETRLDRAQIIERCFTPKEEVKGPRIIDSKKRFNGSGELAKIAPTSSFIMPQIREVYDANHIDRLGRSICDTEVGQLQNCGFALISEERIDQYLEDLNTFFSSDIQRSEVPYHAKFDGYLITIFGHSRQLGVASINRQKNGHPDHGTALLGKVFKDVPFWQVLEMQAVENTGLMPDMWDRSRAIVQYKQLRTRDGIPPTQEEIAAKFGVDKDQVWRAERYEALPDNIKKIVVDGKLPYSGAIEFHRMFGLYDEEYVVDLARKLAARKASTDQVVTEIQRRVTAIGLTSEIVIMVEEGSITLSQAKELDKLKAVDLDNSRINQIANWICAEKPDLKQVRRAVNHAIQQKLTNNLSLLGETTLDPEQVEEIEKALRDGNTAELVRSSLTQLSGAFRGLRTLHASGAITPEIAKELPVRGSVQHEFGDILERISSGHVTEIDAVFLPLIYEVLHVEDVLADGENSNARIEAARILVDKVHAAEGSQPDLFSA